jgi:Helicase
MDCMPAALELELIKEVAKCDKDPFRFAECVYPWGKNELADSAGPRNWQAEILQYIGSHLSNPATRYTPCMVAVASGHGIGKSALVSMVIHWATSTCEDTKIVVTANTGTQLATKTVPEVHKWFRLAVNAHWWEMKATSITVRDPAHSKLWRTDFIPWSEHNTEAFAGLHNKGKRIVLIFDEASAIPPPVWQVAEGALTDEATEIIWLAFGNPTQNTGRFRECFGSLKHRWKTFQIDSRTVEGTNKAQIVKWEGDYGDDSDFFRVRVRGEFPRAGSSQFIGSDIVAAARKYRAEGYGGLPKILSVDVARFGDDQTVIGTRQGRKAVILAKYRGKDTAEVGDRMIEFIQKEKPHATVIDDDGIGGGVTDHLKYRGFTDRIFAFHGGAAANDATMYFNRRAEMWGTMRDWLKEGAEIPDEPDLETELTSPEYGFSNKGQIQLERKDDMKKRGLASPDSADMLAMTFSVTVAPPPPEPEKVYRYPGEDRNAWMQS